VRHVETYCLRIEILKALLESNWRLYVMLSIHKLASAFNAG